MIRRKSLKGKERITLEGVEGTATRALMPLNRGMLPRIEFTMKVDDPSISEIVVELELEEASKFVQQALHAIQAATPRVPRPAGNQLFF